MPDFIHDIHCVLCGIKTGEVALYSRFFSHAVTDTELGFVDSRCASCEATHGNFKHMVDEYHLTIGDDYATAEAFVKAHPKRIDFDLEIARIKPSKEGDIIMVKL